ncbi:hypothetical protein C8J57DRAFT_1434370 [Mycena rebaudengoi]|nr:hypothetical protein C8J57DRAFT_1434370 [Mycena rebaudengoi]
MVNTMGNNGYQNGECKYLFLAILPPVPPSVLTSKQVLIRYAALQLKNNQKLSNLATELNYHIGVSKLKMLNKQFDIPTVRKPPPFSVATTLVCDKLDDDVNQGNGPATMKTALALDGHQIPRDTVQQIMKDNQPGGSIRRYPGRKDKIPRKNLTAIGVFQEVHCDGHEKLSSAALKMGPVSIPIYGFRDKASGLVCHLVVVPDARHAVVIGHVYLDFITEFGVIPLQVTFDKGSETGDMFACHTGLRLIFTLDLDPILWPITMAIKGTHNIPIKSLWAWLRKNCGRSLREYIEDGKTNGLFNAGSELHINLFHWLWPQIVRHKLDEFKLYWNYHPSRKQEKKLMTSGAAPIEIFRRPQAYGVARLSQPVDQESLNALWADLSCTREEAMRWVTAEF